MSNSQTPALINALFAREELPLSVRDAAVYLGVSPQTVYLLVERKQIPHLRVMGRNIRFLKSELEPLRAQFKQEIGNGKPSRHDGVIYQRSDSKIWWMRYRDTSGVRHLESTGTEDWNEAQRRLCERLQVRDDRTLEVVRKGEQLSFNDWVAFFMENYSKPSIRAAKTQEANGRAMMHLQRAFGSWRLVDMTADDIEQYLGAGSRNAPS
jgi:excisionase family DNA binding protein